MTCSCTTGLRRIQLHMPPALRVFFAARAVLYARAACFASRELRFMPELRVLRHAGGAFCPSHVFCATRAVLYVRAACFASRGRCFMTETRRLRHTGCALCLSRTGCILCPRCAFLRRAGCALCPLRRAPAPSPHTLHTPAKPPTYTLIHAPTGRPPRVNSILNRPSTCGKERKKVV